MAGLGFAPDTFSGDSGVIPSPLLDPSAGVPEPPPIPDAPAVPAMTMQMADATPAPQATPQAPRPEVPSFDKDPIGAIGFVLQSVAAGSRGQTLPADKIREQQQGYDAAQLQKLQVGISALDHGLAIAKSLPSDQQEGFIKGYGGHFDPYFKGFTDHLRQAAATPNIQALVQALPGVAEFVMPMAGNNPAKMLEIVGNKNIMDTAIYPLVDAKYGQSAQGKLASWEAAINKVYPGGLDKLRDPTTGQLNVPFAQLANLNAQIVKTNPEFAMKPGEMDWLSRHGPEVGIASPDLAGKRAEKAATTPVHLQPTENAAGQTNLSAIPTVGPNAGAIASVIPAIKPAPGTATNAQNMTGNAYLATLTPERQETVKAYAEGRLPQPTGRAAGNVDSQRMLADVMKYDPTFAASRYDTRKEFLDGKGGVADNINSISTAIGHLGSLDKAINALDNTSYPILNTIKNTIAAHTGDPRMAQMQTAANAVGAELTRAFRGAEGSEKDVEQWRELFNNANSYEALHGVVQEGVKLLGSRLDSLASRYERGMYPGASLDLLTPSAKTTLQSLGGAAPAAAAPAPAAQAGSPPASALQEGQATTFGNGQVWTLRNGQPVRVR